MMAIAHFKYSSICLAIFTAISKKDATINTTRDCAGNQKYVAFPSKDVAYLAPHLTGVPSM